MGELKRFSLRDFDLCRCGDYRHQHLNGDGLCLLRDTCWPAFCKRFALSCKASTVPSPYPELARDGLISLATTKDGEQ